MTGTAGGNIRLVDVRAAPPAARRAGRGELHVACVAGRTVVTGAQANSPLKLLAPRRRGNAAWVFTSTYGGGLVSGDEIALDVEAGASTTLLLGTQASTKVYAAARAGATCSQTLNVSAGANAVCVIAPDPVVCFGN